MSEADLKPAAADQSGDFSSEQKRYLEGFVAGVQIAKAAKSVASVPVAGGAAAPPEPTEPMLRPSKRRTACSLPAKGFPIRKSSSARSNPSTAYERLKEFGARNEYPRPPDNFRWRFFGLFYVAPRANLQIREIEAHNAVAVVEAIQDLGLCSRGSGADNIRNVTGTPTAGIDPQELIDTRPYAREWHFHILNDRSLYGLPRKFNVAFDGAGTIPVLEDTNDIGFQAVQVNEGFGLEPGVWFKLCLGGITGHHDFARDTGVLVQPQDACKVADVVVRLFVEPRRPDRPQQGAAEIRA